MGSREHARPAHPAPVQGARARCRVESEWRRERDSATDGESRRRRNVVKNCLGLIKKNLRYTSTCPAHNVTDFSPACDFEAIQIASQTKVRRRDVHTHPLPRRLPLPCPVAAARASGAAERAHPAPPTRALPRPRQRTRGFPPRLVPVHCSRLRSPPLPPLLWRTRLDGLPRAMGRRLDVRLHPLFTHAAHPPSAPLARAANTFVQLLSAHTTTSK